MKQAFTLIELLVVVLIIGILAAVALPQYQKAVIKSRFIQLKVLAHAIANAQEVYYLANNDYATNFEDLDIQMPTPTNPNETGNVRTYAWGSCNILHTSEMDIECWNTQDKLGYSIYYNHSAAYPGRRMCWALNRDLTSHQNQLCKAETNNSTYGSGTAGAYSYIYQ